jgi:hypothetical protein
MGNEISKLSVTLTANASGLVGGLKPAEHEMEHFGEVAEHVNGIMEKMPELLAEVGIGFEIFEAFKEASSTEQAFAQIEASVQSTGAAAGLSAEELKKMAEELSEVTLYEKSAVAGAEAVLASFGTIKGDQFKDVMQAAADLATKLAGGGAGDLKGAVELIGKALADPEEGFKKLKRAGVIFTDSQIEMATAMQDSGDKIGAMKVLIDQVEKQFGGSALAAANTFTGQMTQLKKEVIDIAIEIGTQAVPAIKAMVQWLKQAADWAKAHGEALAFIGKAIVVTVTAITGYKLAMLAITIAQKAWNAIQAVTLALQGPKGWAILAGAVLAGAAAYGLLSVAQADATKDLDKSDEAMKKANDALNKMGQGGEAGAAGLEKTGVSAKKLKDEITALNDKLSLENDTFGMSARSAEIWKLQMQGATDAQLALIKMRSEELDQLDKEKKLTEEKKKAWEELEKEAKRMAEDLKDPWEKLDDQLKKINQLEKLHLLDSEQAAKASEKASDEAIKALEKEHKVKKEHEHELKNSYGEKTGALEMRFTRGFTQESTPIWQQMLTQSVRQTKADEELVRLQKLNAAGRVTVHI